MPQPASFAESEEPSNPADNVCTGQPSGNFRGELLRRAQSFQDCYSTLLEKDPLAGGDMTALLRIGAGGDVQRVWLDARTLPDRDFKQCIVREFSVPFLTSAPLGGCIIAEVPLSFTSVFVVEQDPT